MLNEQQKRVLHDMLHNLEQASYGDEYHQTITASEFMDHVHYVKEAFGYDYIADKEQKRAEDLERMKDEPVDRDSTVYRYTDSKSNKPIFPID